MIERATFHNAENGFACCGSKPAGHRDLVTVVGPYARNQCLGRIG